VKIAVVGGGSTYSPELLHGLAERAAALGLLEVALYDVAEARLDVVGGFSARMMARMAPGVRVVATRDLDAALEGATFVVTQIRVGGQAARLADEQMGRAHGVIGQETTGPGGMAKALRTIPVLRAVAARAAQRAPGCTLINFTNPVSIVTEALLAQGAVRTLGLCNIPISQRMELAAHLGVSPSEVELDSVGLNHLSFVRGVRVHGQEILPRLIDDVSALLQSGHKPKNIPDLDFPAELLRSLGMIPSDYLRYFFMAPETVAEQRAQDTLRAQAVMAIEAELLAYYADPSHDARPEALTKRGGAFYSHAALEIIEAVHGDTGARLVVDTRNDGAVPELPPGACVELPCRIDARGANPLPQAPLPPEIRGLIQHVKAYEELTVRAAATGARRDVYLALLTHPLVPGAEVASRLADAIMARGGFGPGATS
jgi:6-phospho-beta-glucosidase